MDMHEYGNLIWINLLLFFSVTVYLEELGRGNGSVVSGGEWAGVDGGGSRDPQQRAQVPEQGALHFDEVLGRNLVSFVQKNPYLKI